MGFVSKRGFTPLTNFILKINSTVVGDKNSLKGIFQLAQSLQFHRFKSQQMSTFI